MAPPAPTLVGAALQAVDAAYNALAPLAGGSGLCGVWDARKDHCAFGYQGKWLITEQAGGKLTGPRPFAAVRRGTDGALLVHFLIYRASMVLSSLLEARGAD